MASHLKVLMLLPHIGTGGDWAFVRSLSNELHQIGYELQLSANNVQDSRENCYSKVINFKINQGIKGFFQSITQIPKFDRGIKIIHANSTNTLLFAILLRLLWCSNAAIVFTFHLYLEDNPVRLTLKRMLFSWVDYLHCSSEALKRYVEKHYQHLQDKIVLIHLGVDEKFFYRVCPDEQENFRQQLNLLPDDFVLLFAGRLNPEKNVRLILETLALEHDAHPNVKLLISGTGPCQADLEDFVQRNNLQAQVRFIGYRANMRLVYGASNLLILPSSARETFGLVIIEAALCGLPSLRSDTPGATDQITDGVDGLVFENDNPQQFRTQLIRAIASPEQTKVMGEAAYTKAIEQFTASRMAEQFNELYQSVSHRAVSPQHRTGIKHDTPAKT